ncbi:lipoate--protein ligase [Halobacteriovorax sp. GB3]|uniref:lipoate--protein ligase n=1 Tax=Halobacteriovorax sp. GB3 TaxID=2719615 RepID=UPI002360E644|nr:lipoate--protein ligase [Halobacteriovorax sp. GB3]MDD0853052.1 lipoate--protein ligase [Halobacteriovorax sp. GB3]
MTTKTKIRIFMADTFDPWFNLATEDWLFRDMNPVVPTLFLWRNENTVVIGRFQNPWTECNVEKMEEDGIKLARRQSGGGAVFHDLGNTNFTFLNAKEHYDKNTNNSIIIDALSKFGIKCEASGRNDMVVLTDEGEKKISGSAFKETKDRAFHHGTLLIDADLTKLSKYLNPNKKKLESKGIKSVRARVTNLVQENEMMNHDELCQAIIESFQSKYGAKAEVEHLSYETLKEIPELQERYEKLKDWNWRFGETPKFSHFMEERFSWGTMEVHLDSHKGMIKQVKIYSDSLHPEMIELLQQQLCDIAYDPKAVAKAVGLVMEELPMISDYLLEFSDWLSLQVK